ncbi:phage protein NinX family protein [Serratia sp. CY68630]|uniref:phage protein NinX family protein n=1 Tax=Serratia sp. CY68630 TaxID=3383666 RepID=UPI003F9F01D1
MTDYSKMSDFEINKAVAEITGDSKPKVEEWGISRITPDYCDNPAYAWPIIEQNYISLTFDGISWDASSSLKEITYNAWKTHPYQPLRLAMIVFLMMKDAEKC